MLEGTDLYSAWSPLIEEPKAAEPVIKKTEQPPPAASTPQSLEFSQGFNEQYEKEQKLLAVINELKRRQATTTPVSPSSGPSYWDKLQAKKKELVKFLQSALIIVFALSVHFLIHHYFTQYIASNDVSFERELILRVLYPVGVAFIAWNVMLIYK